VHAVQGDPIATNRRIRGLFEIGDSWMSRATLKSLVATAALCFAGLAHAWPDKAITIVVPFPPGGPSDISARPLSKGLQDLLGQPVIIDNRAGAGGNIGAGYVAKSKPDGYTLMVSASGPLTINQYLYKNMPFDPKKDLLPVTNLMRVPQVVLVHPSVPVNNLKELIAYIKAKNGDFAWGSAGNGTTQHMTGEMLKSAAGLKMDHIPYKGSSPAITDLVGGQIPLLIDSTLASLPMIKAGKIKAIAVTGKKRFALLPNVPTADESGLPGFESYAWYGLFAPAKMAPAEVDQLNKATLKFMQSAEFKHVLEETGSEYVGTDPATFAKFVDEESARWKKVSSQLNITLD
jgi:tripartite-type tricarboxylate transporter receptor subunit TctC